jgi:transcriptional regulator with PAS, ATPase and Fis domain
MIAITAIVDRVARTDVTVLICGESGVGKERVSQRLHRHSRRHDRPFVKVNCAALPFTLLESELFGYEPGAFTGADRQKPGKFELAHTGTIFLDEVGEMPMAIQAKLLQVLQDGVLSRLGGRRDTCVDVRAIAATNRDLASLVHAGEFREDLYYRLNVVDIHVPPLRERREEIPLLVEHFLDLYARQYDLALPTVSPAAMRRCLAHSWPGNIRELENFVKRVVVLGDDAWPEDQAVAAVVSIPQETLGLKEIGRRAAREAERQALLTVLESVRWHRADAARILRVSYKTLLSRLRDLEVEG